MKLTVLITVTVEVDDALPVHVAVEDPDGLGAVREVVRDLAAEIRHRVSLAAPSVRIGDVSAVMLADAGTIAGVMGGGA